MSGLEGEVQRTSSAMSSLSVAAGAREFRPQASSFTPASIRAAAAPNPYSASFQPGSSVHSHSMPLMSGHQPSIPQMNDGGMQRTSGTGGPVGQRLPLDLGHNGSLQHQQMLLSQQQRHPYHMQPTQRYSSQQSMGGHPRPGAVANEQPPPVGYQAATASRPLPANSLFMSENVRTELKHRVAIAYAQPDPNDLRVATLPRQVKNYHSLVPLDENRPRRPAHTSAFAYPTNTYKCISSLDGLPYTLMSVENFRLQNEKALSLADRWRKFSHPNVAGLREVIISKDFHSSAHTPCFVHAFHAGCLTLEQRFSLAAQHAPPVPDVLLWSIVCQLVSAVRAVHASGLACRTLHPTKIIISPSNRVRIAGCGVADVLLFDASVPYQSLLSQWQTDDLVALGKLVLVLACAQDPALLTRSLNHAIEFAANVYGPELKGLLVYLLAGSQGGQFPNIHELVRLLAARLLAEADEERKRADFLEHDLSLELENGRLFRIVAKLGFINERMAFESDPRWSETGDRYLLKLFRDFVFHQEYADGRPLLDLGHVVDCLNKLDVGVDEQITLMSRDNQSLLVVSYKDLKDCFQKAIQELSR